MRTRRNGEGGAIAVVASIVLLAVGAFMALALNVGLVMHTKGQLQNGSDSAALAAAGSLDGTAVGLVRAQQIAVDYANAHSVTGVPVNINPNADVVFGRWDFGTRTFTEIPNPFDAPIMVDAVRLLNGRDDNPDHNPAVGVFFSHWLGREKVNVSTAAVAVSRGARADCPMPFVLPSCLIEDGGGGIKCGPGEENTLTLRLTAAGEDNVGFIFFLPGGTGNSDVPRNILDRCSGEADARLYPTSNGNDLNDNVIQAMLGMVNPQGQGNTVVPYVTDDAPLWGDGSSSLCVFNDQRQSFPIGNMSCPPGFNEPVTIAQYARVHIQQMTDQNGKIYSSCPTQPIHNWQHYTASLPGGGTPRTMLVNVICGANNGLDNSGVVLRLVE